MKLELLVALGWNAMTVFYMCDEVWALFIGFSMFHVKQRETEYYYYLQIRKEETWVFSMV